MDLKALLNADVKDLKNIFARSAKSPKTIPKGGSKKDPMVSKDIKETKSNKSSGITQRALNYTFLFLSIVIFATFWVLIFQPSVKKIDEAKQRLLADKRNYESKLVKVKDKNKVEAELKLWQEYEDKYKTLLQDNNMSAITPEQGLYTIEKYTRENFIRIDKLQFVENAEPNAVTYMLNVGGDYNSIKMFVYDMEQLVQPAIFRQVDMQYKDDEIHVVFKVVFYNK